MREEERGRASSADDACGAPIVCARGDRRRGAGEKKEKKILGVASVVLAPQAPRRERGRVSPKAPQFPPRAASLSSSARLSQTASRGGINIARQKKAGEERKKRESVGASADGGGNGASEEE